MLTESNSVGFVFLDCWGFEGVHGLLRPGDRNWRRRGQRSFTVLELLIVIAILGLLASIIIPNVLETLGKAKRTRVIGDMRTLEKEIYSFWIATDALPDDLSELSFDPPLDPWGRPYEYLRILGGSEPRGKWRKDRFLVPLNSDFDLYSRGPDGLSRPPLTARHSRDDIVRAGNGAYIGVASEY